MKYIGIVIDKQADYIINLTPPKIKEYQNNRVYGDELPLANWGVIHAGMKTMYWKTRPSDIK